MGALALAMVVGLGAWADGVEAARAAPGRGTGWHRACGEMDWEAYYRRLGPAAPAARPWQTPAWPGTQWVLPDGSVIPPGR